MNSRFYFTVLVCTGVGVCPKQTGAQDGHKIDLRPLMAPPFATANTPVPAPIVEQSAHDRIIQRRLQYRQRRAALLHVVHLRRFAHIDFDTISKAYTAKKKLLHLMVTNHRARQKQIASAKRRAITEVKVLATAMRERFEAEERAMAAAIRKMREENPDYADQALRRAVAATEKRAGETITETENLPLLSKTVDLSYIDPIRRNEQHTELPAKLTSPIRPTTSTQPGVNPGFPFIEPHNPASLKEAAELEALIAYKKEKALDRARQAKRQSELSQVSSSKAEKTRKLRELVDLYVSEKISPREYYRRRELILGGTTPQDKE
jgi:hypothetical protein